MCCFRTVLWVRGYKKINEGGITLKTAIGQKNVPHNNNNNNNVFPGLPNFVDEIFIQISISKYRPRILVLRGDK